MQSACAELGSAAKSTDTDYGFSSVFLTLYLFTRYTSDRLRERFDTNRRGRSFIIRIRRNRACHLIPIIVPSLAIGEKLFQVIPQLCDRRCKTITLYTVHVLRRMPLRARVRVYASERSVDGFCGGGRPLFIIIVVTVCYFGDERVWALPVHSVVISFFLSFNSPPDKHVRSSVSGRSHTTCELDTSFLLT